MSSGIIRHPASSSVCLFAGVHQRVYELIHLLLVGSPDRRRSSILLFSMLHNAADVSVRVRALGIGMLLNPQVVDFPHFFLLRVRVRLIHQTHSTGAHRVVQCALPPPPHPTPPDLPCAAELQYVVSGKVR